MPAVQSRYSALAAAVAPLLLLHLALRASEPLADSTVAVSPSRVVLWFTARPQVGFSRIRLTGNAGEIRLDSIVSDSGNALVAQVPRVLEAGPYTVDWQTASADGHPIRGRFSFTVAGRAVSPAQPTHVIHVAPAGAHAEHSEYRSVRWMEFVALLTILGVLGFRHGVLPPLAIRGVMTTDAADRARRIGQGAIVLYLLAALVRLHSESVAIHGAEQALDPLQLKAMLATTLWGAGWLLGVVGALFLAAGWKISKRRIGIGSPIALTGALGMALSPALSGHAGAGSQFVLGVTLDVLHVIGAGVWMGGLLIVLLAGIPAMLRLPDGDRHAAVSALVNSFHPIALFCAPIVVLSGLGTAWLRLFTTPVEWNGQYARTLLLKLVFFAVLAGFAGYNAMKARRRLGLLEGTRRLRLTATAELVLAAVVLAITAALVSTPLPATSP